jgi:acetyl-CoA carboxylase carboxyl transferase subunit alpha
MMENAVYSVITPEGCAAILWKSAEEAPKAAEALRLTASDLKRFELIDEVIPEPKAWEIGADGDSKAFEGIAKALKKAIGKQLRDLSGMTTHERMEEPYQKFRKMGEWA